jgi:geranylgeranyl diphosphate synthase type I
MAGLDVLDEIEDGDHSPLVEAAGIAQALNISTLLLMLAQSVLLNLTADNVVSERIVLFAKTLADAGVEATGGQHRDLAAESNTTISYDDALQTARLKAGVLVACACKLGALVATDDPELLALYYDWGIHYGTAAQLSNDLHDVDDQEGKSDIARQKGTLPLLYERASNPTEMMSDPRQSGALHFTWVVLEIERQRCAEIADRLADHGQAADNLRTLLGSI